MTKKQSIAFPYIGNDASYTFSEGTKHSGIYIYNSDAVNTLYFSLGTLSELPLRSGEEYNEFFQNPPLTVTIRNPSGCKFMIGRLD